MEVQLQEYGSVSTTVSTREEDVELTGVQHQEISEIRRSLIYFLAFDWRQYLVCVCVEQTRRRTFFVG
jgi:hypothetical protein